MNTCETCKWWSTPVPPRCLLSHSPQGHEEADPTGIWGACNNITTCRDGAEAEKAGMFAYVDDKQSGYFWSFNTQKNWGCVQWEERDFSSKEPELYSTRWGEGFNDKTMLY